MKNTSLTLQEDVTVMSENSYFKGELRIGASAYLNGIIEGSVLCSKNAISSSSVFVGETSRITGKVECNTLVVEGTICGDVIAHERIEIRQTGAIYGSVKVKSIVVISGGILDGSVMMQSIAQKEVQALTSEKDLLEITNLAA